MARMTSKLSVAVSDSADPRFFTVSAAPRGNATLITASANAKHKLRYITRESGDYNLDAAFLRYRTVVELPASESS